jgi:hypothetical protein
MAKAPALREPERGEKTNLMRELLAMHPESKNMELASMYPGPTLHRPPLFFAAS